MKSTSKRKRQTVAKNDSAIDDAIYYVIDGHSRSDIIKKLKRDNTDISDRVAIDIYDKACLVIKDKSSVDVEEIVNLHVEWYEKLWRKFDCMSYVPGKNTALRQKEKILGLLKEENVIKIDNEVNVDIKNEPAYDVSKLTRDEQIRLERYLKRVVK